MNPQIAKDLAVKVLKHLEAHRVPALCVGGCARDVFNNQDVRDIDIVINHPDPDKFNFIQDMSIIFGGPCDVRIFEEYGDELIDRDSGTHRPESSDFRDRICCVTQIRGYWHGEIASVDILHAQAPLADLREFVGTFDLTINQCYFGSDGALGVPPDHYKVRLVDGVKLNSRILRRIERLRAKYPQHDWSEVMTEIAPLAGLLK
jgi:hypothetical protein